MGLAAQAWEQGLSLIWEDRAPCKSVAERTWAGKTLLWGLKSQSALKASGFASAKQGYYSSLGWVATLS